VASSAVPATVPGRGGPSPVTGGRWQGAIRRWRLAAAAGALALAAGCMSQAPPSNSGLQEIGQDMASLSRTVSPAQALRKARDLSSEANEETEGGDRLRGARLHFEAGYLYERLRKPNTAAKEYAASAKAGASTAYQTNGEFRMGEVIWLGRDDYQGDARKEAIRAYNAGGRFAPATLFGKGGSEPQVWVISGRGLAPRTGIPEMAAKPVRAACYERLDVLYHGEFPYKFMHWAVGTAGRLWPGKAGALAIILIAVVAKLALTPLTNIQFRSMKAMQRIQPLIKELQEKHKSDRQALAQAQMRLFKEHRVNPLGGCLPLLIQMPILIFIYRAVDMYKYQFWGERFLWVHSLAESDMLLLILYAVSMYFSMRLTTTPSADQQQQQMQNMMAIMMPFMFLLLFRGLPSAFILYWFVLNLLSTAHQAYILRQPVEVATPPGAPKRKGPGKPGGQQKKKK
jgi:YidC/Oxa1 family membrane protein insertase